MYIGKNNYKKRKMKCIKHSNIHDSENEEYMS